jgi:hypothetical protein
VFVHGALHLTSSNNPRLDEPEVFDPAKCAKLTAECARLPAEMGFPYHWNQGVRQGAKQLILVVQMSAVDAGPTDRSGR